MTGSLDTTCSKFYIIHAIKNPNKSANAKLLYIFSTKKILNRIALICPKPSVVEPFGLNVKRKIVLNINNIYCFTQQVCQIVRRERIQYDAFSMKIRSVEVWE